MGEAEMMAKADANHDWLQQLLGEWTFESEAPMGPGEPPMKSSGRESVRTLVGGLWVICEAEGEMPGGAPAQMIMTLGYNPESGRFSGTWVGSMMTHMWIYSGWLDEARKVLTLEAEGPVMGMEGQEAAEPGAMTVYRDAIEIVDENTRITRSTMPGPDGKWITFMTATYTRVR